MPTRFLINLVAANLLITFVLVPLILIDLIWPSIDSEYLPFYCYILRGMTTLTSSASILGKNPINDGCIFPLLDIWCRWCCDIYFLLKNSDLKKNIWHCNFSRIPMISASLTKLKIEKWKNKNNTLYFSFHFFFCSELLKNSVRNSSRFLQTKVVDFAYYLLSNLLRHFSIFLWCIKPKTISLPF